MCTWGTHTLCQCYAGSPHMALRPDSTILCVRVYTCVQLAVLHCVCVCVGGAVYTHTVVLLVCVTHKCSAVDTTDYHCWCVVFMLPPSCSVAVGRRIVTVSMSAVAYSRRCFFSAEGELLHTYTHTHTEREREGGSKETCSALAATDNVTSTAHWSSSHI